jgi:hypothetical protein
MSYPIKLTPNELVKSELLKQAQICRSKINDIALEKYFLKGKQNYAELDSSLDYWISEMSSLEKRLNYLENN